MNLAELVIRSAERSPDAPAVVMGARSLTYRQLVTEGERVARGLLDLGVGVGDRVLMFADNCVEYLVCYHAAARIGAIFAPVHASFKLTEVEYVLDNAQPSVIIAQGRQWDVLKGCASELPPGRISLGTVRCAGTTPYRELGREGSDVPVHQPSESAPALICYTSGTTDRPYPVTRSHATEIWNAETYAQMWDYRPGDRVLVPLPLSWVYGLTTLSQGLLAVGASVVLHAEFDADDVLTEVESSAITQLAGTMSMYVALLQALQDRTVDLSTLRHLYGGGEPTVAAVVDALESRIGIRLTEAYALTEAAPVLAVDPLLHSEAPRGTAGRLVPGAGIRLVDGLGRDVPPGEIGEAWLRGPGLMLGYWNEPELTRRKVTDGWFRSGDLLREEENGYFFVVGRSSDMIIRNGARVAPAEVEAALTSLAGVTSSIAVGVPDDDFGECIVAFVVAEPGCVVSVDDIYMSLSERIARFKLPTEIFLIDELPLGPNAKRDRRAARRNAEEMLRARARS